MKMYVLFLLIISLENCFAQNSYSENECLTLFHNQVDSLFTNFLGKKEYLLIRDSIQSWCEIEIDSSGVVVSVKTHKESGFTAEIRTKFINDLKNYNLKCLWYVYFDKGYPRLKNSKIMTPLRPRKYLYIIE